MMNVLWELRCVTMTVRIPWEVTHVAATLDMSSIVMDAHAMVCSTVYNIKWYSYFLLDVNECSSVANNICQHVCVNTPGSYTCGCNLGYELNVDGRNCDG